MTKLRILTASVLAGFLVHSVSIRAEDINYGDPTASFSSVGVSRSADTTQVNAMYGFGSNIFMGGINVSDRGDTTARGRFFHVTDGLGYSVDVIGTKDSLLAVGGIIYKMELTNNIMVFPMLSAGVTSVDVQYTTHNGHWGDTTYKQIESDNLIQPGIYAMYAFDSGHWLYANPKSTYLTKAKEWVTQAEVGGGYMISDNASVGFKVDFTAESKLTDANTVGWLQANYYF
ncbi:hypothetical protein L1D61_14845 [Vibrio mediterranei]|nr:hypothetical protein [Vibrio mediterranei]